jgi:hypothetical protein
MPNTIDAVYKYIARAMIVRGFEILPDKRRKFSRGTEIPQSGQLVAITGQHPQYDGLRFAFTTYNYDHHLDFVVKRKSKGSGYTNLLSIQLKLFDKLINCRDHEHSIEVAYSELKAMVNVYDEQVVPILVNGYPEPYVFQECNSICRVESINHTDHNKSNVRFVLHTQLREVEILSVVAMNHGFGTVNIHNDAIQKPNTDCFFLAEVLGHSYATGNIITDGTRYWPVSRISRIDLASPRRNRRTVIKMERDFGKATLGVQLSSLDQKLVNTAIADWCKKHFA